MTKKSIVRSVGAVIRMPVHDNRTTISYELSDHTFPGPQSSIRIDTIDEIFLRSFLEEIRDNVISAIKELNEAEELQPPKPIDTTPMRGRRDKF